MADDFGQYHILRKIAAGGMAEVVLAKQVGMGGFERLVCLKRILPHLSQHADFIAMFQDEARIAANLLHPNIAQIYDIGKIGDTYYIAMEYVRGEDVRNIYNKQVAQGAPVPADAAAHIIMGCAAGLEYAHRQTNIHGRPLNIVHRDINPQNVVVSYGGHVKVIDFGLAKAVGKINETEAGALKGKYSYMSPEQATGGTVDGRTDIFALGITLYEITTGTRLFRRDREAETLQAVISCYVPFPTKVRANYPPDLEAIVLQALQRDPNDRFQHARDLERALEMYLLARNHTPGASSLATYMQGLFADKLAEEVVFDDEDLAAAPVAASRRPTVRGPQPPGLRSSVSSSTAPPVEMRALPPGTTAKLVVKSGLSAGEHYAVTRSWTVFGRVKADVDILLDDRGASRRHAALEYKDGGFFVVDLDSTNGTFVDDRPITRAAIAHGGEIRIGDVIFVLLVAGAMVDATVPDVARPMPRLDGATVVDPQPLGKLSAERATSQLDQIFAEPLPTSQRPFLEMTHGPMRGRDFRMNARGSCVIGGSNSDPAVDVVVRERGAADRHAVIVHTGGTYTLHDLGASAGTFVNGKRVVDTTPVTHGSEIRIGSSVLTFWLE